MIPKKKKVRKSTNHKKIARMANISNKIEVIFDEIGNIFEEILFYS